MPYDPHAPTPESRNLQFVIMYVALIMTTLCIAQYLVDPDLDWVFFGYGILIGGLINAAFAYRSDDYFRAQCFVGMSWSIAFLAIYLIFLLLLHIADFTYVSGFRSTQDGEMVRIPMGFAGYANDASLLAMLIALAFYSGFAFAMLRDRFFMGGDEK